jgi:phosphoglycolate phosphatase-like HAD superfamily hydrolase
MPKYLNYGMLMCRKITEKKGIWKIQMSNIVFDLSGTLITSDIRDLKLIDGIEEVLKTLKNQGHDLFVWTNNERPGAEELLKELGVWSLFSEMRTASEVRPKPDPEGIEQMMEGREGIVYMVGDSSSDIYGSKAYGAISIGACFEHEKNKSFLLDIGADFVCLSPNEILEIIKE